jgi:phenylacetate-CoA ligase
MNTDHFDSLETRSDEVRAAWLAEHLPAQIAHAKAHSPWFAESLRDINAARIHDRAALASLPVLRKNDLLDKQKQLRPFGGLTTSRWSQLGRVFASPGPIYEPEGLANDYWRTARALFAAGFRRGDLVHNSFSYHMTPGAWILESGARALGCSVFPAGVGQTEQQIEAMIDLQPNGYVGTPSFLRILLAKAFESGLEVPSLTKALVSGEAFLPAVRDELASRGVNAYQAYATADVGLIAYESNAREGLIVDEGIVLEIVRPGTGDPVPDGDVGEVVVTSFSADYPLVRFGTGDLSAVLPGISPCGRTSQRIRGWLGRADQTTKIKGMFVHPEQIAKLVSQFPAIARARLVVSNPDSNDRMTLLCETDQNHLLRDDVISALRAITKLGGEVQFVPPGSIPNDGKVISDERKLS